MKTITAKANQTLHDVAIEQYGTVEAVGEILNNNPMLQNDPSALAAINIDALHDDGFYIDVALRVGQQVQIDTDSFTRKQMIIKEITSDITTYEYGTND